MKKIIFCLMIILVMHTMVLAADVDVQINGQKINFTDNEGNTVNAQIINSRTMVPMRKIFEVLGANVEWDGANKIVKGTKGDTVIELQIDNNVATKTVKGKKNKILLDTSPTLVEGRTMVPLRFIAESLDKQVGWDGSSKTAIIIDYNYFAEALKTKFPDLYSFLQSSSADGDYEEKFTHKYHDLNNSANDTVFMVEANPSANENSQIFFVRISGTSELAKEIISAGYSNVFFDLEYKDDLNTTDKKAVMILDDDNRGVPEWYDDLNIAGSSYLPLSEMFRTWADVSEKEISINTFNALKNDFDALCKLFTASKDAVSGKATYNATINYSNYNVKYFDIAKLDDFIFDNEHIKVFNMVNKLLFKNDILRDEMLYDNTYIKIKIDVLDETKMMINIETANEYNEKNEYVVEFGKQNI